VKNVGIQHFHSTPDLLIDSMEVYNMKHSKMCPKCRSGNIVRIDGYAGPYGTGNNVMTGNTIFSAVNVNRYVCCACGYTEEWIDKDDIEKIANSKKAKR